MTDGIDSSAQVQVSIDIAPVATAPTLSLGPTSVTTQLFDTGWEDAPAASNGQPVVVSGPLFDGWTVADNCDHPSEQDDAGFEVWSSGESMTAGDGTTATVQAAPGDGSHWLELGGAGQGQADEGRGDDNRADQSPTSGITRQIDTVAGDTYNLGFDLAASLGADTDDATLQVLLDGRVIATYNPASHDSALNWQHAEISFTGSGGTQTLSIVAARSDGDGGDDGQGWHGDEGRNSGVMLDNVALAQTQPLDSGDQGGTIALQAIDAALVDTDGSETLRLTLSGLPAGSTVSDGSHSATVAGAGQAVDISGWNTGALSLTPPADFNGSLTLQATATSMESVGGSTASVSRNLTLDVAAVAQPPVLTLAPPAGSVSRSLIATTWEPVCNNGYTATMVGARRFAGWTLLPVAQGMQPAFEIRAGDGQAASPDAGREWLGLTNGVGSRYQSPGISQSINTIAGAQYTFSFHYAGQPGLTGANTQIGVYLDGQLLGSYSDTSGSLDWQPLSYRFTGDGGTHTLSVQLINGTDTRILRGAMIDDLNLIETLPDSASTVYGFADSPIALPQISDGLAANDPGLLATTLLGLPEGATVSDGSHSITIDGRTPAADISGWNLAKLSITVPHDCRDDNAGFTLQVVATSTDAATGSTASTTQSVTVNLLDGEACATPVGVNPYVSYVNRQPIVRSSGPVYGSHVTASPLTPLAGGYVITTNPGHNDGDDGDGDNNACDTGGDGNPWQPDMDGLWNSLSDSVSSALFSELGLDNKH